MLLSIIVNSLGYYFKQKYATLHSLHKYTKIFDHILLLHIRSSSLLRYANQNYFILYFFLSCPLMQQCCILLGKDKTFL